jgi:hypothetical protein
MTKKKIVKLKFLHDNGINVFHDNHYFRLLIDNVLYDYHKGNVTRRPSMTVHDNQWSVRRSHTFSFSEAKLDIVKKICEHSRYAVLHSRDNDNKIVDFCECKLKCFPNTEIIFDGKA